MLSGYTLLNDRKNKFYLDFNVLWAPYNKPNAKNTKTPPSIGSPGGGGGLLASLGGGIVPEPTWARQTELITKNKIEARILMFRIFIRR
jgi:hypothetical protein